MKLGLALCSFSLLPRSPGPNLTQCLRGSTSFFSQYYGERTLLRSSPENQNYHNIFREPFQHEFNHKLVLVTLRDTNPFVCPSISPITNSLIEPVLSELPSPTDLTTQTENQPTHSYSLDSTLRKRRRKIKRHKYRKRLKKARFELKKLGRK
eukprot:TRINITY_DN6929_c0_g1_i1.p1 TRINITY_DN6929_c0_g1~~TRINITY_DN6929_c0_g1_i1.p1  ORF type:complete len:152 (-),score=15.45 TRINITY_DN6929_c0_g1_i1:64-519(-)